ncbi:MAG: DUF2147 domain-containing protein [Bacteroidales bacterium]|nr:DUF2147 domain-containing protein [Bacteroidales bacterium]
MKRLLVAIASLLCFAATALAQNQFNDRADNIIGLYSGLQAGEPFRVEVSRQDDGSYRAQVVWVEHDRDAQGNKRLDVKNPDKSLRSVPYDRVVLISGLRYNSKRHRWDGARIYDPLRGIRAPATVEFTADGRLKVKGTLLGISETVFWDRVGQ